jgi:mRNA interferase MazF
MRRGDVYVAHLPGKAGRRPVVVLTRTAAIEVRTAVTVAPVTRTVRGIASEVPLGVAHGLRTDSVANCDSIQTIERARLRRRLGQLAPADLAALDRALRYALGMRG